MNNYPIENLSKKEKRPKDGRSSQWRKAEFESLSNGMGLRIGQLLDKKGMSVDTLAEKCGVAPNSIRNYQNGNTIPDTDVSLRMAKAFNVSLDYLVTGKESDHIIKELIIGLLYQLIETIKKL